MGNLEMGALKCYLQRKPARERRDKLFAKIKRIAKLEFFDLGTCKGWPTYTCMVITNEIGEEEQLCQLGRYDDNIQ